MSNGLDQSTWSIEVLHEYLWNMDGDVEIRPIDGGAELWFLNSLGEVRNPDGSNQEPKKEATFWGPYAHVHCAAFASGASPQLVTACEKLHKLDKDDFWPELMSFQMRLMCNVGSLREKFTFEILEPGA